MKRSPFADTRFEYEVRHLYYIQEDLYATLEKTKPCFLIGSRGTGKTTLLRSLSWRERSNSASLRSRLGVKAIKKFIGVYIKLPDIQLDGISYWLSAEQDFVRRAVYSRYLELIQLQELFDALSELGASGEFAYSASDEVAVVRKLTAAFGAELHFEEVGTRLPSTFADLSKSCRTLRRIIERASQQGSAPSDILVEIGSPTQLCGMSREIAQSLAQFLALSDGDGPYFKVCFDEAETLDSFGVEILNTWVRLARGPLFHVISFVSRPESLSKTLLPNLTVQSADVEILDLDSIKDRQFRTFAEGVATLRLREFVRITATEHPGEPTDIPQTFQAERLFGKLNINFLLQDALRQSVSPFAKELLERSYAAAGLTTDSAKKGDDSAPPIYETYLHMRVGRSAIPSDEPKWSKRRLSSQLTRKAMIAAYLSIMGELRTDPKYAYADMLFQLSDSCIRDFLNNLEYMFRESKQSLAQFLSNTTRPTVQHAGLLAASKAKVKSLPTHGVNHPSCTAKLISGLGALTSHIQSRSMDGRHLKSTERGIYQLEISTGHAAERAVQLIIEAAEAGFLKIVEQDDLRLAFRVHTSLAPAFGFSYRGAYYPVTIDTSDILSLADAADDREIYRIVAALVERIDAPRVADLFTGNGNE